MMVAVSPRVGALRPAPAFRLALRLLLTTALLVGQGGCVERLVDFHVRRLVGVKVTGIDGRGFDLRVRCELENPNSLGAAVTRVRFSTYLGQHLLGEGRLAGPVKVAARSSFTLEVPVRVAYDRLPADLPRQVADGTVQMRTETTFTATTRLGSYTMRLRAVDRTEIAEAIKVAIRGCFGVRPSRSWRSTSAT